MVSDYAVLDLSVRRHRIRHLVRRLMRMESDQKVREYSWAHLAEPQLQIALRPSEIRQGEDEDSASDYRWRRHPQLLKGTSIVPMSDSERQARKFAVRGLYCAHKGELEESYLSFAQALRDHDIELTELPAFWQMPRAGILAAAKACEATGRFRDAARIQARLRTEFRPRNVVMLRPPGDLPVSRRSANGQ